MRRSFFAVVLTALTLLTSPVSAEAPTELTWDSLVPEADTMKNPMAHLTTDQQVDVEILAGIRSLIKRGIVSETSQTYQDAIELEAKIRKDGLDPDKLLADYAALQKAVLKRNKAVVAGLDGKLVRMPGYALPLEFTGTAVKEFLLVPYVGACIHVPPPPANQTVFVELDQSFKPKDLYEPVWITGRMRVKATQQSLTYVDGTAGIDAAYTLEGVTVEPYEY